MSTHNTGIEWTHHEGFRGETWNPLVAYDEDGNRGWFCTKVSSGCRHCYAERMNVDQPHGLGTGHEYSWPNLKEITWAVERLHKPIRWTKRRCIFVNSMTDLHHQAVPTEIINQIYAVMALCPNHRFLVLTKRPEQMARYLGRWWEKQQAEARERVATYMREIVSEDKHLSVDKVEGLIRRTEQGYRWPLPNLWIGTSAEDQETASERIPKLLSAPGAIRFLSAEPLLDRINLRAIEHDRTPNQESTVVNVLSDRKDDGLYFSGPGGVQSLDWVIAGGESGPSARPMHPDWAMDLSAQCATEGVPYFFKQWGAWCPPGATTEDCDPKDYPQHLFSRPDEHQATAVVYQVGRSNAQPLLYSSVRQDIPQTSHREPIDD